MSRRVVMVAVALCQACAVLPAPPLGPAPSEPSGLGLSFSFAVPVEPYRAELVRAGAGGEVRATVRRPWNRTDSRIEPALWAIPQALSVRYVAGPLELAVDSTWLAAGGALRLWGQRPEPRSFGTALVVDAQHGYHSPDWQLGGSLEVHRRFAITSAWLGLGASMGTRRHNIDLPFSVIHSEEEGSIGDFAPQNWFVLRPETRLDGLLGWSLDVRPTHVAVTLAPYGVLHAGEFRDAKLSYFHTESFSSSFGVILRVILQLELAGVRR